MRRIALVIVLTIGSAAQGPAPHTAQNFAWNWREAQELNASRQSLATSKEINDPERAKLLGAMAAQNKGNARANEYAARTRVKLLDLNRDGISEAICQASDEESCSPTGNCSFRIFQKSAAGYKLLLSRQAVQTFTIQSSRTGGYSDIVLAQHGSATEQGLTRYQFRDGQYRKTGCYDAHWTYLGKDGQYHDLKKPRITGGRC